MWTCGVGAWVHSLVTSAREPPPLQSMSTITASLVFVRHVPDEDACDVCDDVDVATCVDTSSDDRSSSPSGSIDVEAFDVVDAMEHDVESECVADYDDDDIDVPLVRTHRPPFENDACRAVAVEAAFFLRSAYSRCVKAKLLPSCDLDMRFCARNVSHYEDISFILTDAVALFRATVEEASLERGLTLKVRLLLCVCLLLVYKLRTESTFTSRHVRLAMVRTFLLDAEQPTTQERFDALETDLDEIEVRLTRDCPLFPILEMGVSHAIDTAIYARHGDAIGVEHFVDLVSIANFHAFAAMCVPSTDPVERLLAVGFTVAEVGQAFLRLAERSLAPPRPPRRAKRAKAGAVKDDADTPRVRELMHCFVKYTEFAVGHYRALQSFGPADTLVRPATSAEGLAALARSLGC
jgi:hypothetical protein